MVDNCDPRKIDSNATGLSVAETICGRLPTMEDDGYQPTWYELEPNEYDDFGGETENRARTPLNASRQRKKGVTVDLDASGGFNIDFTRDNLSRLQQGFFFADFHEKPTSDPINGGAVVITEAVAASDTLAAAEGLSVFRPNMLVLVSGFLNSLNNGPVKVTAVTDTALTLDKALADEDAPDGVVVRSIGFELANGAASIVMVGNLPSLVLGGAAPVASTATLTVDVGNAVDGDTLAVAGQEYTFGADLGEIPIGANVNATAVNIAAAINGDVMGITANKRVTAVAATDEVTFTAKVKGSGGNLLQLEVAGANLDITAFAGGTGFSFLETELFPGEWAYLGADLLAHRFANNVGYGRVMTISDSTIVFDKTTWAPQAEAGAGKTIHLYTGNTLRNEKDPDLIVTRMYEFERTLGKDQDGTQAEYLTASVMNELTLNIPVADMLNADISFVSRDAETRTGAEGRKPGPFVPAPGQDGINTSSNILRIRMAIIDPATSRPSALFAYITEGSLSINNNVEGVKAVAVLGNMDVSVGDFDVGGELTAIFSTVAATRAVRNNADVTFDLISAADNAGFVYDIPLLSLGGGRIEVERGEPIKVPLEMMGAENPNGYTLLYTNWPYLPTLAMPDPDVTV